MQDNDPKICDVHQKDPIFANSEQTTMIMSMFKYFAKKNTKDSHVPSPYNLNVDV